jgi:hypothetical protein
MNDEIAAAWALCRSRFDAEQAKYIAWCDANPIPEIEDGDEIDEAASDPLHHWEDEADEMGASFGKAYDNLVKSIAPDLGGLAIKLHMLRWRLMQGGFKDNQDHDEVAAVIEGDLQRIAEAAGEILPKPIYVHDAGGPVYSRPLQGKVRD